MRILAVPILPLLSFSLVAADVKEGFPGRNIQTWSMTSASLKAERKVNVLLPLDYETSTARYPVLYLLHGYSDDHTAWSYMTNLSLWAARHKIIVVMPDGGVSFYVNAVADPQARYEDFIARDLPAWADSRFRTLPLPRSRAIAGLSMGGYGAMFIGLKHHRRFTAIGAFSGALAYARRKTSPGEGEAARRRTEEMLRIMGPPDTPERAARDPFVLLEKVPAAEMPMIYIACGGQDFLIQDNRDFVKLLAEKKVPYEYREISPRGHSWDFWDDHVRVFLDLLAARPGFRAD